ncbi:MAG: M16 family metallopeptidase [Planctomycetota bacterium]
MDSTFAGFALATAHGTPVLARPADRYKTFRLSLLWQRPLDAGQAARAILPQLLQHGTAAHPDRPALARAREMLYGLGLGFATGRCGESTVLRLSADAVAGDFLPDRPDQFAAVLGLLREHLLRPQLEDGAFPAAVFERERAQALAAAGAAWDDKAHWARLRAVIEACEGEPYGVPDHGGEAALEALDARAPAAMLDDFLRRGRRAVLLSGKLPADPIAAIEPLLASLPQDAAAALPPIRLPAPRPARTREERAPMQQAKLVLVHRVPPPTTAAARCALQVAVSLWGGGPHSRLFREVRERLSLCYYASAGGDADKGLVLVQVACDAGAAPAVREQVAAQLRELAAGAFTDDELATAIAQVQSPLRSVDDSAAARLSFTAEQWLRGIDQTPEQRIAALAAVGRDAVAAAAASLWLDLDYALLPEASA